jgi:hypothetical protein
METKRRKSLKKWSPQNHILGKTTTKSRRWKRKKREMDIEYEVYRRLEREW